ncbi:MAG TPA: hypothetical protein DCE00_01670 [Firmicutes bacterium]|jgi:hypothetical protein|nr:hypothetical protein [Bacillota bacterium]HAA37561.1 hypothetical protein [Bacillota bacterium]
MAKESADFVKKYVYLGILFISLLGSLIHFLYDLSGKSLLVGLIAPINESVWEHLKLPLVPTLLWWLGGFMIVGRKKKINFTRWFISTIVALVVCPLFIVSFHYTYRGALGLQSVVLDILSFFLGTAAAQLLALHIYLHAAQKKSYFYLAVFLLLALISAFLVFTFVPPRYPLFRDAKTGEYGLVEE